MIELSKQRWSKVHVEKSCFPREVLQNWTQDQRIVLVIFLVTTKEISKQKNRLGCQVKYFPLIALLVINGIAMPTDCDWLSLVFLVLNKISTQFVHYFSAFLKINDHVNSSHRCCCLKCDFNSVCDFLFCSSWKKRRCCFELWMIVPIVWHSFSCPFLSSLFDFCLSGKQWHCSPDWLLLLSLVWLRFSTLLVFFRPSLIWKSKILLFWGIDDDTFSLAQGFNSICNFLLCPSEKLLHCYSGKWC